MEIQWHGLCQPVCPPLACTKPIPVRSYFFIRCNLPQVCLHAVQPQVPPQQTQLINKHCPEGEEMEVGGVCRCRANSRKSESSKVVQNQEENLPARTWMCPRLERGKCSWAAHHKTYFVNTFSTKVFMYSWSIHIKKELI